MSFPCWAPNPASCAPAAALSARRLLPRQLSERRRGKGKDSPAYKAKMKEDAGEKSAASGRGRGEGTQIYDFVHSAPWLRHQYNDLRRADDRRTPLWKDAQWRIVLYFRRGDRGTAGELSIDLSILWHLFRAVPSMTVKNTRIVVIGEVPDKEMDRAEMDTIRCAAAAVQPALQTVVLPAVQTAAVFSVLNASCQVPKQLIAI